MDTATTRARVGFIRSAQAAGLSLAEIRDVLAIRDGGHPPYGHVTEPLGRHLADMGPLPHAGLVPVP
ncbi:hypothetical protein AQI95_38905 [Streptomyces yokosukanensis]|uniref:HTH merR-type domain-containing protein n=1 Tax=Streptomyces yokosukanensis TaxID=67386 RepID=A0A101NUA0_9ACTN|nr:MerR family DNA-binding protein [Streptomyces yokosukanensis]KUM99489.1 hypothetical protein AQI95_38905 [Streptomyces yokosukanensis]